MPSTCPLGGSSGRCASPRGAKNTNLIPEGGFHAANPSRASGLRSRAAASKVKRALLCHALLSGKGIGGASSSLGARGSTSPGTCKLKLLKAGIKIRCKPESTAPWSKSDKIATDCRGVLTRPWSSHHTCALAATASRSCTRACAEQRSFYKKKRSPLRRRRSRRHQQVGGKPSNWISRK